VKRKHTRNKKKKKKPKKGTKTGGAWKNRNDHSLQISGSRGKPGNQSCKEVFHSLRRQHRPEGEQIGSKCFNLHF